MATKMRQKKYLHNEFIGEHYYQNQDTTNLNNSANQSNYRSPTLAEANAALFANPMDRLANPMLIPSASSGSSGLASSTTSSNRPLVTDVDQANSTKNQSDVSFCFLSLSILCLAIASLAIAITFIFPFWVQVTIADEDLIGPDGIINITDIQTGVSLITNIDTNLTNHTSIVMDFGIWEVKFNHPFELAKLNSISRNSHPETMLWLDGNDAFLEKLLAFINVTHTHLFIVETMEILHLIFTFLTFCFTSFTLCLCNSNKTLCWFLLCFMMALVSFLSGLSVLVLFIIWHAINIKLFVNNSLLTNNGKTLMIKKDFLWTFWLSVGANSLIVLAASLIIIHILIETLIYYFRTKNGANLSAKNKNGLANGRLSKGSNKKNDLKQASNNFHYIYTNGNGANLSNNMMAETSSLQQNGKMIPRLQMNYPYASPSIIPNNRQSPMAETGSNHGSFNQHLNSPSYIFYTGHGNYRKQSLTLDDDRAPRQQIDYDEATGELINQHVMNYAKMMQNQHQLNSSNMNDHAYSNVNDPNHLNPADYLRYSNYR